MRTVSASEPRRSRNRVRHAALLASLWLVAGCFAPLKNVYERSALEQELTSAALYRGVAKLDLEGLEGAYRLRVAAPARSDTAVIRRAVERRMMRAGLVPVAVSPERASPERESRELWAVVPFAGVDIESTLFGIPFVVPGLPVAMGDISIYRSSALTGRARIELSVVEDDSVELVASAEASRHYRNFTFLTFIGPFRSTDLEQGPLPGDEEESHDEEEEGEGDGA